ncbi:MAG: tetratricopeptide repeat protein, partial [Verrucomicrobiota bacterium]
MSRSQKQRTRNKQKHQHGAHPPKNAPAKSPAKKTWLVPLLALAVAGVAGLSIFNPFSPPDDSPSTPVEQKPVFPAGPPTVESLKQEAFDTALTLKETFPDQHAPLALMGMLHYQFGEADQAIEWWQRALSSHPNFAHAGYRMARIYFDAGDFEKTIELCRQSIAIDPRQPDVHERMGEALLLLGRPEEAVPALQTELQIRPDAFEAEELLGQAYLELNRYEDAIRHYESAVRKVARAPRPYYGLAKAYTKLGQRDKARSLLETFRKTKAAEEKGQADQREKHNDLQYLREVAATIHTSAGETYRDNRRDAVAVDHWRRAAFLHETDIKSHKLLSDFYQQQGRWAEALVWCEQLTRIEPKNPVYYLNQGVVLGYLLRLDESEKALRTGIRLAPRNPAGYHALLQVLMHEGRKLSEAKPVAQQLAALQPSAENFVLLSKLCQQTGDHAGALAAMQRATQLAPGDPGLQ